MNNPKSNQNPDDPHFEHPGHHEKAKEKIDIRQSGLGRDQGQTPADEQVSDQLFSQIDHDSADSQVRTEINEDDIRDQADSTTDWDAENSRTGRNK